MLHDLADIHLAVHTSIGLILVTKQLTHTTSYGTPAPSGAHHDCIIVFVLSLKPSKKRKEKTTPFIVNLTRSLVIYQAALEQD